MSKNVDSVINPYLTRWLPDRRYRVNKKVSVSGELFNSHDSSVTDKEAYRVTLASLRGQLAQGSGKIDVGSYSLAKGQEYDPRFDFSYLHRPDLSIVELDEAINRLQSNLDKYNDDIKLQVEKELATAQAKVESMKKSELEKAEVKKE